MPVGWLGSATQTTITNVGSAPFTYKDDVDRRQPLGL